MFGKCLLSVHFVLTPAQVPVSSGNALVSINAVALHWDRWVTAFGQVNSLTIRNQPPRSTQPYIRPGSVRVLPAIAGKVKACMAHSDCGWTCDCAGKTVRSLENTCHTWALLRWWFTKRRYIKCTFYAFTCVFVCVWAEHLPPHKQLRGGLDIVGAIARSSNGRVTQTHWASPLKHLDGHAIVKSAADLRKQPLQPANSQCI